MLLPFRVARRVSTIESSSCAPVSTALMSAVFIACSFAVAIQRSCEKFETASSINYADGAAPAEFFHAADEAAVWQHIIAFRLHYHHEISLAFHVK